MAPLAKFLDKLQEGNQAVTYQTPSPWDTEIHVSNGFEFKFHTDALTIGFSYARARVCRGSSGLPELEPLPVRSYADLLQEVLAYTDEVVPLLASHQIGVNRIGVVATVPVRRDQAPPGLADFMTRLDGVSGSEPISSSCQLFTRLQRVDGHEDRCHHNVRALEGGEARTVDLVLDFQRYFDPEVALGKLKGISAPRGVADDALRYFEAFGSGQ